MIVLALDTATPDTVVGLAVPGRPVAGRRHRPAPGERPGHAGRLLPLARELLEAAGLGFADVDRLGVGVGPGTFTGLRIGVATARALAQGTGAALVAVSSLEALALGAQWAPDSGALDPRGPTAGEDRLPTAGGPVLACLDARRGEAFAAAWSAPGQLLLPARAVPPDGLGALLESHPGPWRSVGDGSIRFRDVLEGAGAQVPEDGSELHRVGAPALCRLAERGPEAGPDLRPDYLREPDAMPQPIRPT